MKNRTTDFDTAVHPLFLFPTDRQRWFLAKKYMNKEEQEEDEHKQKGYQEEIMSSYFKQMTQEFHCSPPSPLFLSSPFFTVGISCLKNVTPFQRKSGPKDKKTNKNVALIKMADLLHLTQK